MELYNGETFTALGTHVLAIVFVLTFVATLFSWGCSKTEFKASDLIAAALMGSVFGLIVSFVMSIVLMATSALPYALIYTAACLVLGVGAYIVGLKNNQRR